MKALRRPHLVLSHVRQNHAVFGQAPKQFVEEADGWLRQAARIELRAIWTASNIPPRFEIGDRVTAKLRIKSGNCVGQVPDHGKVARPHTVELCRINFEVNDLGVRSETRRITGYAVVEAGSENQQEIRLMQRRVRSARPVHAHHAEVVRRLLRNGPKAVNRGERRNVQVIEQPA